jgi:ribosomal protein L11 methyltransferase
VSWLQLRLDTRPELVEALEEQLLGAGAVAVTMEDNADQPVLEPGVGETPLWQQTRLTGLFTADANMVAVLAGIPKDLLQGCNQRVEILEDKDWEREWISHYQPMRFGERLWICPSWLEPPDPGAVNLLLDPGLAFGTGTHPTTALCLGQLEQLTLQGQTVVDYGCGSGILAIAALKLGASRALGVDNDPQALVASRENARRNDIADDRFTITLPNAQTIAAWQGQADVVVANILAGPLAELSATLLGLLKPDGVLLLSGLLNKQAKALCDHYGPQLALSVAGEREDWVCLQSTPPAAAPLQACAQP